MNDEEITNIFKSSTAIESHFLGFFAVDQLHNIPLIPYHFAVCNTDVSEGHGYHWYSLICFPEGEIEVCIMYVRHLSKTIIKSF